MILVIPCHNEPNLLETFDSISACQLPSYPIEVIVVVNQSEAASDDITRANQKTIEDFKNWKTERGNDSALTFHMIEAMTLPKKHAGVGLARKTGMDEALRRFVSINFDGTIVCLDADCKVSENYFTSINVQFHQSEAGLGEVHFEHPYEQETDDSLKQGIVHYELFLRYYVKGLRQAGFPHAIHTIGSCMLVRASVYAKHGGMNKRKAGEDFYFLHKIVPHEPFTTVTTGKVFPSCRTSDRVPFGTGKAQQDWLDQEAEQYLTYDPIVFTELAVIIDSVKTFFDNPVTDVIAALPKSVSSFFTTHDFASKINLIKTNCKNRKQFHKQFFIWFDGFLCMKFIHFLRDHSYPNVDITNAAASLIESPIQEVKELLDIYRVIDLQPVQPQP